MFSFAYHETCVWSMVLSPRSFFRFIGPDHEEQNERIMPRAMVKQMKDVLAVFVVAVYLFVVFISIVFVVVDGITLSRLTWQGGRSLSPSVQPGSTESTCS